MCIKLTLACWIVRYFALKCEQLAGMCERVSERHGFIACIIHTCLHNYKWYVIKSPREIGIAERGSLAKCPSGERTCYNLFLAQRYSFAYNTTHYSTKWRDTRTRSTYKTQYVSWSCNIYISAHVCRQLTVHCADVIIADVNINIPPHNHCTVWNTYSS